MPGVEEDDELVVLIAGSVLLVVDVDEGDEILAGMTVGGAAVGIYVLAVVATGCVVVTSMEEDGVLVMLIVGCVLVESFVGVVVVVGAKVVVDGRLDVTPNVVVVDTLPCIKVFGHLTSFVTAKPAL